MILFEEKTHTYTNCNTQEKYISVTTLIKNYEPVYDSEYWSLYKALKDVLEKYNVWRTYKISSGGWENVVATWKKNPLVKYAEEVYDRQRDYLLEWQLKRDNSCEAGTAEHKRRENEVSSQNQIILNGESYETPSAHSQTDILQFQDFNSNRIYTELLIYNDQYKLAGQVDWVRKRNKRLHIKDYKTSEVITKESFRNQTLLAPLNDLPNANWYIYNLQMSLYAWMLEQCGYEIELLELDHVRDKKSYQMPYLKTHVERMLSDYATF